MSDLFIFRLTLKDLTRPGRLIGAALVAGVALLMAFLIRANSAAGQFNPQATFNWIVSGILFGYMVTVMTAILATSLISQDLEAKTIPYLLTRPLPRWRILFAKYAALIVVASAAVGAAELAVAFVLFPPAKLGASHLLQDLTIVPLAIAVYSGVFLFAQTVYRNSLLLCLGYALLEPLLPLIPGDAKYISLQSFLHLLSPHLDLTENPELLAAGTSGPPSWVPWVVVIGVSLLGLAASLVVFSTNEYTPMEERV